MLDHLSLMKEKWVQGFFFISFQVIQHLFFGCHLVVRNSFVRPTLIFWLPSILTDTTTVLWPLEMTEPACLDCDILVSDFWVETGLGRGPLGGFLSAGGLQILPEVSTTMIFGGLSPMKDCPGTPSRALHSSLCLPGTWLAPFMVGT